MPTLSNRRAVADSGPECAPRAAAASELPARGSPQARRRSGHRAFSLIRQFSLLSLLCVGTVCVLSSILLSRVLGNHLLERDATILMEVVQSIADVQDMSAYFLGQSRDPLDRSLEGFFAHVARLPDVLRANVYALDQRVLWSSDPTLIDRRLGANLELEAALEGRLTVESGVIGANGGPKPEHLALRSSEPRFVENYLPVRASAGGPVIGVVEIYRAPAALFRTITRGVQLIWAVALAGGAFLYLTLFWIVRRADRLIGEQSERLVEGETLAVIGEITGAITHGIRNPLASIRTSAELCQDDPSPAVREAADDIVAEVDRLSEWVRQLLTYAEQEPARLEAVSLVPLLEGCLAGFERDLRRRGVETRTEFAADLPTVRGERVRLTHAMNSLFANALEAMPGGGRLAIAAQPARNGRVVQITLTDSGVGIPPDQLPRVFAPFFTTKRRGLGLGLPLVSRIIVRFGGSVSIASEPGHGARVTVELPRSSA